MPWIAGKALGIQCTVWEDHSGCLLEQVSNTFAKYGIVLPSPCLRGRAFRISGLRHKAVPFNPNAKRCFVPAATQSVDQPGSTNMHGSSHV